VGRERRDLETRPRKETWGKDLKKRPSKKTKENRPGEFISKET